MSANRTILMLIFIASATVLLAQKSTIEGYVFEDNNRGYINQVKINIVEDKTGFERGETLTNSEGFFSIDVGEGGTYRINVKKDIFSPKSETVIVKGGEKGFVKIEMSRKPGYVFNVTLAQKRVLNEPTDAIEGAKVEVYNNTLKTQILGIDSAAHDFGFNMERGNHYTLLIRKKGFYNKRIEAYVNVKTCILCLDGVDGVTQNSPAVVDNLTSGLQMGTLVANLEMQPLALNSTMRLENIYYDLGKSELRPQAIKELDKMATVLKINPAIQVELSSHTDSRGDDASNLQLSQSRADAAINYLIAQGINADRLSAKGYGETQLVNKCANGVICLEVEHQQNRRTELKITGIGKDPYADKSLMEIIKDEEIESFLREESKTPTQQYKEGDVMPDELKKFIESQKKGYAPNESKAAPIETKQPKKEVKVLENVEVVNLSAHKKSNVTGSVKTTGLANSLIKTQVLDVDNQTVRTEKIVLGKKSTNQNDELEPITTQNLPTAEASKFVDKTIVKHKISTVTGDFDGFTVEVIKNKRELSATNEIFYRYPTIYIDKREKEVAYLVGIFPLKIEADKLLVDVQKRYPKAKTSRYRRGLWIE